MDYIKVQLSEAQDMLAALEGGHIHIGGPFEGRTEAKIADLKRQIATYERIIEAEGR